MTRTTVGVLRGGNSSEYLLSLKTGAAMLAALPEEEFDARDIFIDKAGRWHLRGMPSTPVRVLAQIDVVLNALHGGMGEDGSVARLLERASIPYAGSRPASSALALNKVRSHDVLEAAGIRMPRSIPLSFESDGNTAQMARTVFSVFGPPYIVKPPAEGGSIGIRFAPTLVDLPDAIGDVLDAYGAALVEEFIQGKEATVGIIEGFRNEELYALPPAHVSLPEDARHIEFHMHDDGLLRHAAPSPFSHEEKAALAEVARAAHRALGLRHFSRSDLIVASSNGAPRIYLLEVNTTPGLYSGSSFPVMLDAVGSSVSEFLKHSIALARSAL